MAKLFCLNKKRGFTLIEVVVTIAIIGILTTIGMVSYTASVNTQKQEVLKTTCRSIVTSASSFGDKKIANNSGYTGNIYNKIDTSEKAEISPYIGNPVGDWDIEIGSTGAVIRVRYTENGKTCTYTGSTGKYVLS